MSDNFYLSALDDGGWFERAFNDWHPFGYVGDRDRLMTELRSKSLLRRAVDVFLPRLSIASLINSIAKFDLFAIKTDKTLGSTIIKLVTDQENHRTLVQLLSAKYREQRKAGRYFERIGEQYNKLALASAQPNDLQDRLVTVEGHLLHRDTISQYSASTAGPLQKSKGEWLLCDFPPHYLVQDNSKFKGQLLLLKEDPGFTAVFREHLPFSPDIGWYPYVRVTGFFDGSQVPIELLPSLSLCLIQYRPPKLFRGVSDDLLAFAKDEFTRRNYLDDWSNLILLSYLAPLLFQGTALIPQRADADVATALKAYIPVWGKDLPKALIGFYASLP